MRVPLEVIIFIELLTMIIKGKSPPLLPSSNATVINRNDNHRHLIRHTWIEKNSRLSYVKVYENIYKGTLPTFPAGTRRCSNVRLWLYFGRDVRYRCYNVVTTLCFRRHYYDEKLTLLQRRVFDVGFPT